jgi:hypothetical protein
VRNCHRAKLAARLTHAAMDRSRKGAEIPWGRSQLACLCLKIGPTRAPQIGDNYETFPVRILAAAGTLLLIAAWWIPSTSTAPSTDRVAGAHRRVPSTPAGFSSTENTFSASSDARRAMDA